MNFSWRITKYNPKYRDDQDRFTKDEWTSIYDIGKFFSRKELTVEEYLKIEDLYIDAIFYFIKYLGVSTLEVNGLEKWSDNIEILDFNQLYTEEMYNEYETIKEGDMITLQSIGNLCRLILRENIWCYLKNNLSIVIYFGYDYYMYIGTSVACDKAIEKVICSGLYVEQCELPINI